MNINIERLGKKYVREWIFRQLSLTIETGKAYAILGPNGSGKSTLTQVLSGFLTPTEGKIEFSYKGQSLATDEVYKQVAIASPYTDLIEELTLTETIAFHSKFKPFLNGLTEQSILERLELPKSAASRNVRYFSSGMKQRVKLALAICSDTGLLLLDEPTVTLDTQGVAWFNQLLDDYALSPTRTLIIASNVEADVARCDERIHIMDYKG